MNFNKVEIHGGTGPFSEVKDLCIFPITVLNQTETHLAPYSPLSVFLFYEAKIKPELGTFEKPALIVK